MEIGIIHVAIIPFVIAENLQPLTHKKLNVMSMTRFEF